MKSELPVRTNGIDRKSIIVIASDPLTIRIVRAVFRSAQYGINCLSSCELGGVDLTLSLLAATDDPQQMALINMSDDGTDLDLARQLRLRGYTGPIIAMTNEQELDNYREAGFDGYLRSPVQPNALISLVENHL